MKTHARFHAVLAVPLSIGLGLAAMRSPAAGQSTPDRVTTDTPQYCMQLLDRVSELVRIRVHPPSEVTDLSTEGQRMCDQGQTRGGIMRLRRALILLRQGAAR
ncbi:MAG TPA: hypothetical protein VND19_16740 [Acetobacteraceae bacterium]|nr:hypothetical protein [Acetobacteraceae bacterium]